MRQRDRLSARRDDGLRRLSTLTWRATLLSAVGVVGFMNLFNHSTVATTSTANGSPAPSASPGASPSAKPSARHTRPKASTTTAPRPVRSAAAPAPRPTATLAPPPSTPAPAPTPTATHSTTSGSTGG